MTNERYRELAAEAVSDYVQSACNMGALLGAFQKVWRELCDHAGTDFANRSPVTRAWVNKLASLSQATADGIGDLIACDAIACGTETLDSE